MTASKLCTHNIIHSVPRIFYASSSRHADHEPLVSYVSYAFMYLRIIIFKIFRCDIIDVAVEMDRVLRPGGFVIVQDTMEMANKLSPILRSLHWSITVHQEQFLIGTKGFWRPDDIESL